MVTTPPVSQLFRFTLFVIVILDPTNGTRPSGITDDMFTTAATNANTWMDSYSRGYRFRITEIKDIGGPSQGGASGPSKWFNMDPQPSWSSFQSDTQTDSRYLLRADQLNFYITTGPSSNPGGACPIPPDETNRTACWGIVNTGPWWLVHETGHFFGLYHTFGGARCPNATSPGNAGISGLLPEIDCWTQDQIARNQPGWLNYNMLNSGQKKLVDDTFFDVMSYHNPATKDTDENRMIELQLDRHADTANSTRAAFVSGRTYFVSPSGSDSGADSSTSPYPTVAKAVTAANAAGGDIILLRPGAYNQTLTIDKPCTLRATRAGSAAIGTSVAP